MHFDTATRQRWMHALAYSNADALNVKMQALKLTPSSAPSSTRCCRSTLTSRP
ncbi:hypothetical protein BN1086_03500 [Citrobacter koseri]|uniref:Phosphonate metabolism protein PhnG n=1 Tax=Citrobacter koseri TaxID=545 RepID=A0A078LM65_CITKO|nr:hypothetical protein BN1086_03500 [Citrobacter koseri]